MAVEKKPLAQAEEYTGNLSSSDKVLVEVSGVVRRVSPQLLGGGMGNMARFGFGYGTCTTASATAAKVVTLSNYVLTMGGIVTVLFQYGIGVAGATLNVNGTGAKAIYMDGQALPAGVIGDMTTVELQYDGSYWRVVSVNKASSGAGGDGEGLLVDLDLPTGLLWATRNIDVTQANGFAASPYQYECSFFSWGNTDGHNPVSAGSFGTYSFGSGNDQEPYASSPGASIVYPASAGAGYDAARVNLGGPWRMPTTAEFAELFNSANTKYIDASGAAVTATDKRVTVNGVVGLYLESVRNGKRLFFPCSGDGNGTSRGSRGAGGYYWSSSLYSATYGRGLRFHGGGVNPQVNDRRFYGFAVRAVQ